MVCMKITQMCWMAYSLSRDEQQSFLRVCTAERVVQGSQLTFLNVSGLNKDSLIATCVAERNRMQKTLHY